MPLSAQPTSDTYTRPAWLLALLLLLALGLGGWQLLRQLHEAPHSQRHTSGRNPQSPYLAHQLQGPPAPDALGPQWSALSPSQQQALQPLALQWPLLSLSEKSQWLNLVSSFAQLPADEQAKLHARMAGWARLSPQQRKQARLNFAAATAIAPANKRAQWDAYQNLSAEEKTRLAASAAPKPSGAALALRPATQPKLLRTPAPTPITAPPAATDTSTPELPATPEPVVVETMSITTPSAQGTDLPALPAEPASSPDAPPAHRE